MKYTKLGNSDLIVSRICMGCMGFGDRKRETCLAYRQSEHLKGAAETFRGGTAGGNRCYRSAFSFFELLSGMAAGTNHLS